MLIAAVGKNEWRCYQGENLVGKIHKVAGYFLPEITIRPGHIRFGKWMTSFSTARACVLMLRRGMV